MSQVKVTIEVDGATNAYITAKVKDLGVDGTDTWEWEWGIDLAGGAGYYQIDSGEVQHRSDVDGSFALITKVIERIRGRKSDK